MLPVQPPGKRLAMMTKRTGAWQELRYQPRIFVEFWKTAAQENLFRTDHRQVNRQEHYQQDSADPPTSRRQSKAGRQHQRTEIQRIPRISVRTRSGELLVLLHMTGSQGPDEQAGNDQHKPEKH